MSADADTMDIATLFRPLVATAAAEWRLSMPECRLLAALTVEYVRGASHLRALGPHDVHDVLDAFVRATASARTS